MYLAYTVTDADGPAAVAPPESTQPADTTAYGELAALFAIIERLDTMIQLLPHTGQPGISVASGQSD